MMAQLDSVDETTFTVDSQSAQVSDEGNQVHDILNILPWTS